MIADANRGKESAPEDDVDQFLNEQKAIGLLANHAVPLRAAFGRYRVPYVPCFVSPDIAVSESIVFCRGIDHTPMDGNKLLPQHRAVAGI
jgi:hypothetical protein